MTHNYPGSERLCASTQSDTNTEIQQIHRAAGAGYILLANGVTGI